MTPNPLSRREILKISGATVGTSSLAAVAGCIGEVPRAGTSSSTNGSYTNWLPEPGAVASSNHYWFSRSSLAGIRSSEDSIDESLFDTFEGMESAISSTGVDFDEMNTFLTYQNASITTASYNTDDVVSELDDNDFADETEHEGNTIYLSADEVTAIGVSDRALIRYTASGSENPTDAVEAILDTQLGAEDRYIGEDTDFKTLVDSLGTGAYLSGGTYEEERETDISSGLFEHSVAGGNRWRIDGETSNLKRVIVFEEQGDVDTDDVSEWVSEYGGSDQIFDDVDNTSVQQKGRAAVVTGTIDTDDMRWYHFS